MYLVSLPTKGIGKGKVSLLGSLANKSIIVLRLIILNTVSMGNHRVTKYAHPLWISIKSDAQFSSQVRCAIL